MPEIIQQWEDSIKNKEAQVNQRLKLDLAIVAVGHVSDAIASKLQDLKDQRTKLG